MSDGRHHPLFIWSNVGLATSCELIDELSPGSCPTRVGPIDWASGSLGHLNFAVPCRLSAEAGLVRAWGLQMQQTSDIGEPSIAYVQRTSVEERAPNCFSMLALRSRMPDEPAPTVNGVICMAYTDQELAAVATFYSHFKNAMLCRIPMSRFEAVSWQQLPSESWVHCVLCAESMFQAPSYESPVVQSYLDGVCADFRAYGNDFVLEFVQTTRGWTRYWLNDRRYTDLVSPQGVVDVKKSRQAWNTDKLLREQVACFDGRQEPPTYPVYRLAPPLPVDPPAGDTIFSGAIEQKHVKYFTFGMGSLINTPSRVGTVGPMAQSAIPVRISSDYEFCPCWNYQNRAGGSQLTAGGMVMRSDPRIKCSKAKAEAVGVVYPCPGDDAAMAAQDEREVGYTRYNIRPEYIHSLGWQKVPEDVTVFQYVPNTELPDDHPLRARAADGSLSPRAPFPTREYPLSQTYVDVCILGCLEYSRSLAYQWISGFVGWPVEEAPFWLNDRPQPRRPWLRTPKFKVIDEILAHEVPESLACRSLPSEYGGHYWSKQHDGCLSHCTSLDVSYTSYVEWSQEEVRVQVQDPKCFFFECSFFLPQPQFDSIGELLGGTSGQEAISGMPCRLGTAAGLRRSFQLRYDGNIKCTMPALVRAEPGTARDVNGVLYPVPQWWYDAKGEVPDEKEDRHISLLKSRQSRVEVKPEHITVLRSWMVIPPGARIFAYLCEEWRPPCFQFPISQFSVDNILVGCFDYLGEAFCKEFVDTTDGWLLPDGSAFWLNDRSIARRPWIALGGKYKVFDRILLESKSPCIPRGALLKRRLPEEYSVLAPADAAHTSGGLGSDAFLGAGAGLSGGSTKLNDNDAEAMPADHAPAGSPVNAVRRRVGVASP